MNDSSSKMLYSKSILTPWGFETEERGEVADKGAAAFGGKH